ncbi:MAG: aldo/keto reductase [Eubacteriales bacterium]|nr:aldo/keto reductase [Eubacteriales bacterium]
MIYRKFKALDKEISLLGMGVMRLPMDEQGRVNNQECIDLIRHAVDKGINYIDTAFTYHDGMSERIVGMALKDGYREKVIVADKMPMWLCRSEEDLDRYFEKQIKRLDMDYIDMYLLHNIIPPNWKKVMKYNALEWLQKKKDEGLIKHIGFSFHGDYKLFKEVIGAFPWEFCQIQLNYIDRDEQATLKGLEYARQKGIDVIVMEPLKGGRLTDNVPPSVQKIWNKAADEGVVSKDRSPAEWAFKWVCAQPGVSLVLSGMNSIEQIDNNTAIFSKEDIHVLSEDEQSIIDEVTAEYKDKIRYGCTGCGYCIPCPQKLDIPGIIDYINVWYAYNKNPSTKFEYTKWMASHASDCIACGQCEEKCPQTLKIIDIMKDAAKEFGE